MVSIPVEEVDADVVLGMKERPILTDQEVIDSGAQKRVVPTSGVMYVEDQICLAIVCLAIHLSVRRSRCLPEGNGSHGKHSSRGSRC